MAWVSRQRAPNGPLSAFVKCLWYWEGAPQTHSQERLMPNGEPSIIFNLRDEPLHVYEDDQRRSGCYRRAVMSGARTSSFVIDTEQEDRVFGIQFCAAGAFPFFRMPASEIENRTVELETLWPRTARELRERLLAAATIEAMFVLAERYLMAELVKPLDLHPAVVFARARFCNHPHRVSVASVLHEVGLSQRRFIELFREQVGLTPKAFCRVRRFQRILATVHGQPHVDWVGVALECGYYDQAHFIHDFREFSGLTPSVYLARATKHLNHVSVL